MGNSDSKEEIIIKCSLEEMVKYFFKDYMVVWHDPNVNSLENQQHIMQLKQFCEVLTFTEWEKALAAIQASKAACHVITSGTNGEVLVEEIYESSNVAKIYVFCMNKEYHSTWAKKYQKVSCVETNIQTLINQIKQNLLEWYREISSIKVNLPSFASIFNDSDKSQMNHLHRYLKIIPNFENRSQAKKDFLNLSKSIYTDLHNTKLIADFEKSYNEYNKTQILKWYTKESFLYKVTNNCLRIATADSIQYCRLLLKDIEQAIKDQYQAKSKNFNGLLYRAAYLSEEEWLHLKENLNKEIEMHGFLSVSKEKNIALNFMKIDPSKKVLITIIVLKGPNEEEQGFAEIEEFSLLPQEKEILFNVRSRFTVLETEDQYSQELPYRHLVLLYGARGLRILAAEQNPVIKVPIPNIQDISCCHCTQGSPENFLFRPLDKQTYYCKNCIENSESTAFLCIPLKITATASEIDVKGCLLNSNQFNTPFYGYKCSQCQAKKQKFYFVCTDCTKLTWCGNCFTETLDCIQAQHTIIIETRPFTFWCEKMSENELNHIQFQNNLNSEISEDNEHIFRQAEMYYENHNFDKAIEYYSLYLQRNKFTILDPNRGPAFVGLGSAYSQKREYKKALEYHLKALEVEKSPLLLGLNRSGIAESYCKVGTAYYDLQEYSKAIEYFTKALDIAQSLHQQGNAAISLLNLGAAYRNLGEYDQALEYQFKALAIEKSLYGENHHSIASSYGHIGIVFRKKKEYAKALEYQWKCLNIEKSLYGENHPDVATSYSNIALHFSDQGEYNKALEHHLKALRVRNSLYGEKHPEVAESYDQIGTIYKRQNEYTKAIEYYLKSLDIKKSLYGEKHPDTITSYEKIAKVFSSQKEYNKALEYYWKAHESLKSLYGENHADIATSLDYIATVYYDQGEYSKALEYFFQTLDVRKAVCGENNSQIAADYWSIGDTFMKQEEYTKALEYYLKSLEIEKSLNGENHSSVSTSYNNIATGFYNESQYDTALEYYWKALDISKTVYGENSSHVAHDYNNIGDIFMVQKEYTKALEYSSKSLEIYKSVYGENHADVANSYGNIAEIFYQQEENSKALEYYYKALEIRKSLSGEKSLDVATNYHDIGKVYLEQEEYTKALEYNFKSLEIRKSIHGENHADIATSLENIATVYDDQGEYSKALEYFFQALDVRKSLSGENHADVANSYEAIGRVYLEQKEDGKALEYFEKSLEIRKLSFEENTEEISLSYHSIGRALSGQGEYNKALEYHFKALEIQKAVYGEDHPYFASSYYNITGIYIKQKEYAKAFESCLKSLDIYKEAYGENHPQSIRTQKRLLEIKSVLNENT